ncbi:aryl-alcohol dehydrogenase [Rhodococcus sp. OK519]|uniref:NAD(P)-dependent alcohol dehydrogenase n=1 Tax=Rhodococcus sp. OK519 TaxID=2135729 RepID=UPI000D3984E9|nr:aryl-alcohol dehydrogenase [Rhodococcus sp. OK519]
MKTATAAVLRAYDEPLRLESVRIPEVRADEVLVRIHGVGICHTDLTAAAGGVPFPLPGVLGHEGSGVIAAVGEGVTGLAPGDPVVLGFDSCRHCRNCSRGRPAYCEHSAAFNYGGTRADGSTTLTDADGAALHGNWFGQSSMCSYAIASARNTIRLPSDVPVALAGPLGCGLQTGAGTVFNVLRPEPGSTIAVFGLGAVGMAAIMAARIAGCETVVAVDPLQSRRALALELGATTALSPADVDDVGRAVRRESSGGVDFAVESVGTEAVVRQALSSLRTPGNCATLGLRPGRNPVTVDQGHLLHGRTLTGVIEGDADPLKFLPTLVDLWRQGRFPLERLVQTFPIARIDDAVAAARSGEVVKAVLTFPTDDTGG